MYEDDGELGFIPIVKVNTYYFNEGYDAGDWTDQGFFKFNSIKEVVISHIAAIERVDTEYTTYKEENHVKRVMFFWHTTFSKTIATSHPVTYFIHTMSSGDDIITDIPLIVTEDLLRPSPKSPIVYSTDSAFVPPQKGTVVDIDSMRKTRDPKEDGGTTEDDE